MTKVDEAEVLTRCLTKSGSPQPDLTTHAFATAARNELAEHSATAYAHGVFGVPTFVCGDDIFFGNDRLDLLLWAKRASPKSP
jgi:2-hydroxychromene-2-carboxylate isomerase